MNIWFWVFAIASTFWFALQWALMTKFARKGDSLSMSSYRSLALWISMLPLLLFSTPENIVAIIDYQFELLIAGICITLNVWALYASYNSLPIGISGAFRTLLTTVTSITFWWFIFQEFLSLGTIIFIAISVSGGILLSISRSNFTHLDTKNFWKGMLLASFSGIFSAIAIIIVVQVARDLDPFVAWYFWELEAGLVSLMILYGRYLFKGQPIEKITKQDFGKIFLVTSPTLVGTMGLAFASVLGPVGVVSAIWVFGIVFITIFGVIFFWETLKMLQYLGIIIIVVWLVWIKLL